MKYRDIIFHHYILSVPSAMVFPEAALNFNLGISLGNTIAFLSSPVSRDPKKQNIVIDSSID